MNVPLTKQEKARLEALVSSISAECLAHWEKINLEHTTFKEEEQRYKKFQSRSRIAGFVEVVMTFALGFVIIFAVWAIVDKPREWSLILLFMFLFGLIIFEIRKGSAQEKTIHLPSENNPYEWNLLALERSVARLSIQKPDVVYTMPKSNHVYLDLIQVYEKILQAKNLLDDFSKNLPCEPRTEKQIDLIKNMVGIINEQEHIFSRIWKTAHFQFDLLPGDSRSKIENRAEKKFRNELASHEHEPVSVAN